MHSLRTFYIRTKTFAMPQLILFYRHSFNMQCYFYSTALEQVGKSNVYVYIIHIHIEKKEMTCFPSILIYSPSNFALSLLVLVVKEKPRNNYMEMRWQIFLRFQILILDSTLLKLLSSSHIDLTWIIHRLFIFICIHE